MQDDSTTRGSNPARAGFALFRPISRRFALAKRRAGRLDPLMQGLLWMVSAGMVFALLNACLRATSLHLNVYQVQFVRYFMGMLVMLPLVLRAGIAAYIPHNVAGQFYRGAVHTVGLMLWFTALPRIGLADMTAIGFTGPIFIMLGAWLFFKEAMHWERWLAAGIGFAGVLVVVAPKLTGQGGIYNLVMLASAPMFAASFLLTKALTRTDRPEVIVFWQSITVSIFSLPMAVLHWQQPSAAQWAVLALTGVLGSLGHYCITRSFQIADISATQSVKFMDLVWSACIGYLMFSDVPTQTTLVGGVIICASTIWIARREANRKNAATAASAAAAAEP